MMYPVRNMKVIKETEFYTYELGEANIDEKHDIWTSVLVIKINFEKLKDYRFSSSKDEENNLPISTLQEFYVAIGLDAYLREKNKERELKNQQPIEFIDPHQELFITLETLNHIEDLLLHNWSYFNMKLDDNGNTVWKEKGKREKRKIAYTINERIRKSVLYDLYTKSPTLNPDVAVDELEYYCVEDIPEIFFDYIDEKKDKEDIIE